jgi:murein L,D-transpeptidase YafK
VTIDMIVFQFSGRRLFRSLSVCLLAASTIAAAALAAASSTAGSKADRKRDNPPLTLPLVNPRIVIAKGKRTLQLYSDGKVVRTYRIGLGSSPVEDKIRAGDRRTPEGDFYICLKNPHSQFKLSLLLSYPNRKHAERGLRDGLITRGQYNQTIAAIDKKRVPPQNTRLGGELFIHGNGSQSDWTWGCVALDDKDIQELFDAVPIGTPVVIEH